MSDIATGATADRPVKKKVAGQGWNASADGKTVSKTFALRTAADAGKLAKRTLQIAEKTGQAVELRLAGPSVTVGLAAAGGFVADPERRMIKRLEGKLSEGAKMAKPVKAAKASAPAAPAKAAKATAKPAKVAKPAKAKPTKAAKSAKPAVSKPAAKA